MRSIPKQAYPVINIRFADDLLIFTEFMHSLILFHVFPIFSSLSPHLESRYKIPVAPANYQSQVVETLRAAVASMPEPTGHAGPRYMGAASLNEQSIRQMLQSFKKLGRNLLEIDPVAYIIIGSYICILFTDIFQMLD